MKLKIKKSILRKSFLLVYYLLVILYVYNVVLKLQFDLLCSELLVGKMYLKGIVNIYVSNSQLE